MSGRPRTAGRQTIAIVVLTASVAVLACAASAPEQRVETVLFAWGVETPEDAPAPGRTRFVVENADVSAHELVVLRTRLGAGRLPVRSGRAHVDAPGVDQVGATEAFHTGETRTLDVHLEAGRYVLICNVPGHYMMGMHAPLEVRGSG